MASRYTMLRGSIANLAAAPEAQIAYLDRSFARFTDRRNAANYGNDELALEFDDIFHAVEDMREHGEITHAEIELIKPLTGLLQHLCDEADASFWQRDALFAHIGWERLRSCAVKVLSDFPDEQRKSDYMRALTSDGS